MAAPPPWPAAHLSIGTACAGRPCPSSCLTRAKHTQTPPCFTQHTHTHTHTTLHATGRPPTCASRSCLRRSSRFSGGGGSPVCRSRRQPAPPTWRRGRGRDTCLRVRHAAAAAAAAAVSVPRTWMRWRGAAAAALPHVQAHHVCSSPRAASVARSAITGSTAPSTL